MAANKKDKKSKVPVAETPRKKSASASNIFATNLSRWLGAFGIAVVVFIFYQNCLQNLFTKWDDPGYVLNDPLIKNLSWTGIREMFSLSNPVMGNYHPLTILSYAFEYSQSQLNPWIYHFDSLLLHIFNSLLVCWFVWLLTGRYAAALITALLFGLHPLHVESVAWVAGRKDVLYGFFFLLACISWLYFLRLEGFKKWLCYLATIVLFVCSVLSKPVAVSLPLVLWLLDYWEGRKLNATVIINKIPFLLLSVVFGIISVKTQASSGSLATGSTGYSVIERVLLGCYALVTYLWKVVLPIHLRNFYPYPGKPGDLPGLLYVYPFVVIALLVLLWKYARNNRVVIFGAAFFIANIALLLQFIPVGAAIVADRYSYISFLGLFLIAGRLVSQYFKDNLSSKPGNAAMLVALFFCAGFGYLSHERNAVWHDSMSLWNSNMNMVPEDPDAYNNLGYEYFLRADETTDAGRRKSDYDSAVILLKRCVELKPDFAKAYIITAEIMRSTGQYDAALQNLNAAIKISDEDGAPYLSKAILFCITQKLDSARYNFEVAVKRNAYFPEAHCSFGNYYDMTGQYDSALVQYSLALSQNPDFATAYLNRGKFYLRRNDFRSAQNDFDKLIALKPENAEGLYFRGVSEYKNGNKAGAKQDMNKAVALGFNQVDKALYDEVQR